MVEAIFTSFPFFVCLFWGVVLLLEKRHRSPSGPELIVFCFTAALLYLCHCAYFNREYHLYRYLDSVYLFTTLSVYPLFLTYIVTLTGQNKAYGKTRSYLKKYGALYPGLIVFVVSVVCYLFMTPDELQGFINRRLYGLEYQSSVGIFYKIQLLIHQTVPFLFLIIVFYVLLMGIKYINQYNRLINEYYSDSENKTLGDIKVLLICFIVLSLTSASANIIGKHHFSESPLLLAIPSMIFGSTIFYLLYVCSKQTFTIYDYEKELKHDELIVEEQLPECENHVLHGNILEKIEGIMKNGQIFLRSDLKITDMAGMMGTNRTYLSKTINNNFGMNFSDFINRYRINYVKERIKSELLETDEIANLQELIFSSGFSNESSFYRVFKKETGVSPGEWIKSCQEDLSGSTLDLGSDKEIQG